MMRIRLIALTLLTLGLLAGNAYGATATRTSSFEYDATSGLLTKEVIEPDNSALCLVSAPTYSYDPFGNLLTTVTHDASAAKPDITTTLAYDLRGRKSAMADPDMGSWSYAYDALGQLKRQTDAKGQVATMAYDVLGRMVNRTEADLVSNWTYDSCVKGVGKLCQVTSDNGYQRTYTYDSLGRVSQLATSIDTSYTIAYDGSGRLATTTYPTGFATANVYNAYGYLAQVQKSDASVTYWQATALSALGRVTSETLGNGLTTTRNYDVLDRPLSITAGSGGGNVEQLTYQYDLLGNVTQRVDVAQSNLTESFTYDSLNRLTQVSGAGLTTRSLNYDAFGNITYKSDVGTYTYPASGQGRHVVSSISGTVNTSFTYDANGSLTAGYNRTLTYTSYNLPATIAGNGYTFTYTYNADHERVRLINAVGTSIYLHPAGKGQLLYEKETPASGPTEHKHFITAGSLLVGVYISRSDATTDTRYFHRDHIDSVAVITNASGAVVERFAYEAFGKRRFPNGTADPNNTIFGVTTDRGFTTHEHLDEIALIHMNGRVYDPLIARFMTADPNIQSAADLQAYNRYTYVLNNPLMYTDPSGYFSLGGFNPFRAVQDIVSGIRNGVSSALQDNTFRTVVTVAAIVFAPQISAWAQGAFLNTLTITSVAQYEAAIFASEIVGGAASGFTIGLASGGGDFNAASKGAITGGLFGGIDGYFGDAWRFERFAAKSFGGGIAAEIQGGRFKDGFLSSGVTSGARYAYNSFVGYDVTFEPGENQPGDDPRRQVYDVDGTGRILPPYQRWNIIGNNTEFGGPGWDSLKQGGTLSRALNLLPGANGVAGMDDRINNYLNFLGLDSLGNSQLLKIITIPIATGASYPALMDRVPLAQPQDLWKRRR